MARDFLGTGWNFPVQADQRGNIKMVGGQENIRQSVRMILGTAKGERVMRPEFGCGIHDQVFSSLSPATLNRIEDGVRRALIMWEPRIDVEDVSARQDPANPNKVLINIEYWVKATNSNENMVYPFYTQEAEE